MRAPQHFGFVCQRDGFSGLGHGEERLPRLWHGSVAPTSRIFRPAPVRAACRAPDQSPRRHSSSAYLGLMPKAAAPAFSLDRSAFSVGRLHDEDNQVDYWLAQPPARRIEAVEFLRGASDPEAYSAQRLRRFFEAAKRA